MKQFRSEVAQFSVRLEKIVLESLCCRAGGRIAEVETSGRMLSRRPHVSCDGLAATATRLHKGDRTLRLSNAALELPRFTLPQSQLVHLRQVARLWLVRK